MADDPAETDDKEIVHGEGNETEADAVTESEQSEVGDDSEGATEGDGTEVEEGEIAAADEKPVSRGERRFQKLSNEAKEAREEASKVRRELDEFRTQQRQQAQQESPDQIAQRMALMTPEERLEYKLDQAERRNQANMQAMTFQMRDTADKAAFSSLCASDPVAARYKDKVESKLQEIRNQGQDVKRELLLDLIFGQDTRAKSGPARSKQTKDGEKRIQRQTASPGNSKGDNQPAKRGEKSLEDKLANVTF